MPDVIARLTRDDEPALRQLLETDPVGNLQPFAVLEERGLASGQAIFYGLHRGGRLHAALALVGRARLAIPIGGTPDDQAALGRELAGKMRVTVGRSELVDALWQAGGAGAPWLDRPLRLFRITAEEMGPWTAPSLRQAQPADLDQVCANAAAATMEELGRDPLLVDAEGFRDRVAARIENGRLFVLEEEGEIAFQVALGSVCSLGGQLEGVYTLPVYRGLGLASQGLGQLCRTQLARLPRLVLGVFEDNREAIALYRKLGFLPDAALRMVRAD